MKRVLTGSVFLALGFVVAPSIFGWQGRDATLKFEQKKGPWILRWEKEPSGNPGRRAIRYQQRLFRQGPGDKTPQLLYEETSTGSVGAHLREDGLVLIERISAPPVLVFPGEKTLVEIPLPEPREVAQRSTGHRLDHVWFLDETVFYHRSVFTNTPWKAVLYGCFKIEGTKKTVNNSRLVLEIWEKGQDLDTAAAPLPTVLKVGDFVLWVNKGYFNSFYPDLVQGKWKSRELRVLDLETGKLVDPQKIPKDVIPGHLPRILDALETQYHNQIPELECWAVAAIGSQGGAKEAERLTALAKTIEPVSTGVDPNRPQWTVPKIQAVYDAALASIQARKK